MTLRERALSDNKKHSDAFMASHLEREHHFARYPTRKIVFKCMDGRVNYGRITNTPPGMTKPYRNIGGLFDLSWGYLDQLVQDDIEVWIKNGERVVAFTSFHFSKSNQHLGCAGFGYDTEAARASAGRLQEQLQRVFDARKQAFYAVLLGIETDEDALTFFGPNGEALAVADLLDKSDEDIEKAFARVFPDMHPQMRAHLLPDILGNRDHVREMRAHPLSAEDLDHRENVICLGRGFLEPHERNHALTIGPYDDWKGSIKTAGKIVKANLDAGRIAPEDGVLLYVASLSGHPQGSPRWNGAVEKARGMAREAEAILREHYPEFRLDVLVGVVDEHTHLLHEIER